LSSGDIINETCTSNIPNSFSSDNQLNISQFELNNSDYYANTQIQSEVSNGGVKQKGTKGIKIKGGKLVRLLGSQMKTPLADNYDDTLTTYTNKTNTHTHTLEEYK